MKTINGITFDEIALEDSIKATLSSGTWIEDFVKDFFDNPKIKNLLDNNMFNAAFDKWVEMLKGRDWNHIYTSLFFKILLSCDIDFIYDISEISKHAFRDCMELSSVVIPDNVRVIASEAFRDCKSLTSVVMKDGVTSISYSAFVNCTNLTSIEIPSTVKFIYGHAFWNCENLTDVKIANGVSVIYDYVFEDCINLKSITIPESIKSISDGLFSRCESLTSVTLPNTITSIGGYVFSGCDSLKEITFLGTKQEWKKIQKNWTWRDSVHGLMPLTVRCKDGVIIYADK